MNLQLQDIKKAYGGKEVLKGCSFTFEKGKIYGLLGRNGAGKTTLFNCLTDELPADSGTAELIEETGARRPLVCFPPPSCQIFLQVMSLLNSIWISTPRAAPPAKP